VAYRIYTTDSFVIKNSPSKDMDASLLLFTEQFGLLYAAAKSARAGMSKLKASLQTTNFSSISMVKGREVWRVTNAKKYIALYDKRISPELRSLFVRLLGHVARFCPKEALEAEIFADLKSIAAFIFLEHTTLQLPEHIEACEQWLLLRLLYNLGYIQETQQIKNMLRDNIGHESLTYLATEPISLEVKKMIEYAILQSHL
jgi:recombinational DNA repair protein (RecF pathway)